MKILDKLLDGVGTALFLAIIVLNMAQIVLRNITGGGLVFAEEAMRYFMIWSVMLALWLTIREEQSILAFEYDPNNLLGRSLRILSYLVIIAVGLFIMRYGYTVAHANLRQLAPASGVVMAIPYAAIPVGGALLALAALSKLVSTFRN